MANLNGATYTEVDRDRVFAIWAYEGLRSGEKTAAILSDDVEQYGKLAEVTGRTIRNWAKDHGWDQRANDALFHMAPELRTSAQITLAQAAPKAVARLMEVLNLDVVRQTAVTIGKGDDAETVLVDMLDKDALKAVVQAAQLVLDRTGFSPVGTRELTTITPPERIRASDIKDAIAAASGDELREIEKALKLGTMNIGIGAGRSG